MLNEPEGLRYIKDHGRRPWAARADAVFVSGLQRRDEASARRVRRLARAAVSEAVT
jgi:hypothetical protein